MHILQTLLTIDGMTRDHCVRAVQKALAALPGVRSVDVQLANGTAALLNGATSPGFTALSLVPKKATTSR